VASKPITISAQDMIKAMIAGQRDPRVLASLARTSMKAKREELAERWTACSMTTTASSPGCC
jgi:hypothetical protein